MDKKQAARTQQTLRLLLSQFQTTVLSKIVRDNNGLILLSGEYAYEIGIQLAILLRHNIVSKQDFLTSMLAMIDDGLKEGNEVIKLTGL